MKFKRTLIAVLAIAIASLSFMRLSCEDAKDALTNAVDWGQLSKKAIYFVDPIYEFKMKTESEQKKGDYILIDKIGKSTPKKFVPVIYFFDDYLKPSTFSKKTFSAKVDGKEVPGLYLLTFRYTGKTKPPTSISAAKDFEFPNKSMIVFIPFKDYAGKTIKFSINGKNLKDIGGNPMKGQIKKPTAATPDATPDPATQKPSEPEIEPLPETGEIADEAVVEAPPTPRTEAVPATGITFEASDEKAEFKGNAGRIYYADLAYGFSDASTLGNYGALITTGDFFFKTTDTSATKSDFCLNSAGTSVDTAKKAIDSQTSSISLSIPTNGKKTLKFDYYFVSAEIVNYPSSPYDDMLMVAISGDRGQPLSETIATRSKYDVGPNPAWTIPTTTPSSGVKNGTNCGSFYIGKGTVAAKETASFDISNLGSNINLTITISDLGDSWNTSSAVIDNIVLE